MIHSANSHFYFNEFSSSVPKFIGITPPTITFLNNFIICYCEEFIYNLINKVVISIRGFILERVVLRRWVFFGNRSSPLLVHWINYYHELTLVQSSWILDLEPWILGIGILETLVTLDMGVLGSLEAWILGF